MVTFGGFNDKFGAYVLLARFCDDVSMTSLADPRYGWVTWTLTGTRMWQDTVAQRGRRGIAWRATWTIGRERGVMSW